MFGTLIGLFHHSLIYQLDISGAVITTISVNRENVKTTSLTIDATTLNYNTIITVRTRNNSLNSPFINTQENLNRTRNLKQEDIQTLSHFVNEEIVETMPTTAQQSISPTQPTTTTPQNKITAFPKTTIQTTVKPSVDPKFSKWIIGH